MTLNKNSANLAPLTIKPAILPDEPKQMEPLTVKPKLERPLASRMNELNKSTLKEAEDRCPEETRRRCFDRVDEILLRRNDEQTKQRQG